MLVELCFLDHFLYIQLKEREQIMCIFFFPQQAVSNKVPKDPL